MAERPELSVVVTVVSGAESVRATLRALCPDGAPPPGVEVLVPIERGQDAVAVLAAEFDGVRFRDLGALALDVREPGPFQEHEKYDRRRAAGLLLSRGDVVAIVEDHGVPEPGFCDAIRAAHRRLPHAAIGGVVSNGVDAAVHDAIWLCDFGRYAPPQPEGPRATLTDVCVAFKREALRAIEPVYAERFHEPEVNAELRRRGETLWLDPTIAVRQFRPPAPFASRLRERVAWGRRYGEVRGSTLPPLRRALHLLACAGPVPAVLLVRVLRHARGRLPLRRVVRAVPALIVLLLAWALGEAVGTLRCEAAKRR